MKKHLFKIIRVLSIALIIAGLALCCLCMFYMRRYDGHQTYSMLPPAGRTLSQDKRTIRFAVVSDFDMLNDGLERAATEIKKMNVDFVLCTGDIASKANEIRHVNWIAERIRNAFGDIPFMATPGNHDRESKEPFEDGIKAYTSVFGQPEYWFGYGDSLFISLNTSRESLPECGTQNLEAMLNQERGHFRRLVIFSHVPPIDLGEGKPDCLPEQDAQQLASLLPKFTPTLYICGHHHCFSQWDFAGTKLVTNASIGQETRSQTHGNGFLVVTMAEEGEPVVELHEISGMKEHAFKHFLVSKLNLTPYIFIAGVSLVVLGVLLMLTRYNPI